MNSSSHERFYFKDITCWSNTATTFNLPLLSIDLHTGHLAIYTHIKRQLSFQPMNRVTMFLAALSQQNTLWCGLCLQLDLRFNTQRFTAILGEGEITLPGRRPERDTGSGTLPAWLPVPSPTAVAAEQGSVFPPRLSSNRIIHTRQSPRFAGIAPFNEAITFGADSTAEAAARVAVKSMIAHAGLRIFQTGTRF